MKKKKIVKVLLYLILVFLAVTYLYPVFFILVNSIKTQTQYMMDPFSIDLKNGQYSNYVTIVKNFKIGRYALNTLYVTLIKLLIMIPLALCASFSFAKVNFKGKNVVYPLILSVTFVPFQVIMIPVYVMLSKVHLLDTYTGLIIVEVALQTPGIILLLTSYLKGISNDMFEAAKIDGCGYFRTVFQIAAPVCVPSLATCLIVYFISSWNTLLAAMVIIKDSKKQLIMPALNALVGTVEKDVPFQLTGMVMAAIPSVLIYALLQKYIIMGMTEGSSKG